MNRSKVKKTKELNSQTDRRLERRQKERRHTRIVGHDQGQHKLLGKLNSDRTKELRRKEQK